MYREVSQLLLYSNLGEDSILRQLSGIFSDWAHGECEKPVLVSRCLLYTSPSPRD